MPIGQIRNSRIKKYDIIDHNFRQIQLQIQRQIENYKDKDKLDLVQLCETQMFKFVLYGNIIFDTLEQSSFKKYATCWVFLALRHTLYLYICVF